MLKKLIRFLPVSRQKYTQALKEVDDALKEIKNTLKNITIVLQGFDEAEANHCQIEMTLIQQLQKGNALKTKPLSPTPSKKDGKDVSYQ